MTVLNKLELKRKSLLRRANSLYHQSKQVSIHNWRLSKMPGFRRLLAKISSGVEVSSSDLLPYISREDLKSRHEVNYMLAEAFNRAGNYEQAKVFIRRIWIFSRFDEKYLSLFIKIHVGCGDIASIREAHKTLGLRAADEKKIVEALNHFNAWQYAYAVHNGVDEYHYDFEVLDRIALLAKPHSFPTKEQQSTKGRKIRLAYLMFGMTHVNSVIVKNTLTFAKYHDAAVFDVTFYIPEQESLISQRKESVDNINRIKALGWNVIVAPGSTSEEESLIDLARLIYEYNADILITNAALADMWHYFITSLRPAPQVIGLCQGPPPQYIAPDFDWSISWTKHPLLDCPTDCSLVSGGVALPERKYSREESKSWFGIPNENLVVMSCGRQSKFLDVNFWIAIIDLIRSYPNVYYVAVGLVDGAPAFLSELLTVNVVDRIKIIGWEKDFLKVLCMADIVVDTYPSGGGVSIIDAMALGTPVISFKNNYMKVFSQTEWSPAEEFMDMPELMVERGDFEEFNKVLSKLIIDQKYRESMSELCKARINETSGSPEKMVKDCEQVYLRVIKKSVLVAT